jgi:hypothetical protein
MFAGSAGTPPSHSKRARVAPNVRANAPPRASALQRSWHGHCFASVVATHRAPDARKNFDARHARPDREKQ